jgi:hypothetical protein
LLLSGSADSAPTPPKSFLCKRTLSRLAAARRDRRPLASRQAMGLARIELATSRLSGVRSNQLSYRPVFVPVKTREGKGRDPKSRLPSRRSGTAPCSYGLPGGKPFGSFLPETPPLSLGAARPQANCLVASAPKGEHNTGRSVVRQTVGQWAKAHSPWSFPAHRPKTTRSLERR